MASDAPFEAPCLHFTPRLLLQVLIQDALPIQEGAEDTGAHALCLEQIIDAGFHLMELNRIRKYSCERVQEGFAFTRF